MATLAGMSGTDVTAMTAELSSLLPLWIGKIYQYDNAAFGIRLNGEDKARLLYIVKGVRAHLVSSLPEAPKNPSGFSMYLRKFIDGGKVLAIEQKTVERVLIISIGKGPKEFRLIIELFDEGNLILTDENYVILNALVQKRFRERDVVGGADRVPADLLQEPQLAAERRHHVIILSVQFFRTQYLAPVAKLMGDYGFGDIRIEKDYAGHDRYAMATLP